MIKINAIDALNHRYTRTFKKQWLDSNTNKQDHCQFV